MTEAKNDLRNEFTINERRRAEEGTGRREKDKTTVPAGLLWGEGEGQGAEDQFVQKDKADVDWCDFAP